MLSYGYQIYNVVSRVQNRVRWLRERLLLYGLHATVIRNALKLLKLDLSNTSRKTYYVVKKYKVQKNVIHM